ncbi:MAG: AAA family ATPase, partial [Geobacteraceae bacterium]|nr:AAA family ATPase [Geobacteraceae bacterium]
MYKSFFSLKVKPFELLPNPDFLFLGRSHKKALTHLEHAIRGRSGFILLTGDIGSGKTTVIRFLFKRLQPEVVLSRIVNTKVNFEQLLVLINEDFGLSGEGKDKVTLLRELNEFLVSIHAKGEMAMLVIDEAQNLTPDVLEELRLLSNLETDNAKLLHIVLAGQPELRETLAMPHLLQLRQRICCFCHILPLEKDEIEPYIFHRLERAGNKNAADFSPEAIDLVWRYSRGIPRLINTICDFIFLLAFAENTRSMTAELASAVITDLDFENCYWGAAVPPVPTATFTGTSVAEALPVLPNSADESIKVLLTEILSRVGQLENRETNSGVDVEHVVTSRLENIENCLATF